MLLILRKQDARARLAGDTYTVWGEHHYAVSEDRQIGRIYRMEGGPQHGTWLWFLNQLAMPGDRTGVVMRGGAPTLDEAKAALKVEYEKWQGRNRKVP
jgi:hypothetical protein